MVKEKEKKQRAKDSAVEKGSKASLGDGHQNDIWQDPRFQHLVSDPRFKQLPKSQRKVKIDKRFQAMFTDKKFNVKYTVDKYGRRVNTSAADDLRKYYELDSSASDSDETEKEADEQRKEEKAIYRQSDESGVSSGDEAGEVGENDATDAEEDGPKNLRERLLDPDMDYARGQGRLVTDSSDDESSTEEEEDPELLIEHVWGELDNDAEMTEESTRRVAVCNMDWDRIRAIDLMMLFSSFLPPGGSVLSVKIYRSEYGKQRMKEEEKHGPPELVGLDEDDNNRKFDVNKKDANKNRKNKGKSIVTDSEDEEELVQEQDSDAEEGDEYHMEKLRQYQLNRLRYYYAVVEFDSVRTADKIYQECDGHEYESSATKLDLRFIPDDTTFDDDEPTDVCTELPDSSVYKPRQFTTTALQQAKVDLTWDETAVERRELSDKILAGKMDEVDDGDLRKIVAYSSEEDEEENEDGDEHSYGKGDKGENKTENNEELKAQEAGADSEVQPEKKSAKKQKKDEAIAKYKALLAEINEKEEKEKARKCDIEVTWELEPGKGSDGASESETEDSNTKSKKTPQLTPIEKVLQKRSEKNKKRKEERKKKRREALGLDPDKKDSDSESIPDGVDMNDPYFAEEFANGDFIEPKSKKSDKSKKQKHKSVESDQEEKQREQELQLLLDDDDVQDQGKQHFSLSKILAAENETKSKRKRKKLLKKSKSTIEAERKELEDNFQVNLNDNRFGAIYSSHLFNIDPTDPHYKKTKGMEQIIHEKLKRRHGDAADEIIAVKNAKTQNETEVNSTEEKNPKKQLENKLLVQSLKRKIRMKQN